MTDKEYLQIFKENQLYRSPIVRLIEDQIKVLIRLEKIFKSYNQKRLADYCANQAEEAKWEAVAFAEYEKLHGEIEWG